MVRAPGSTLDDFAEARPRLIGDIEGCEATHQEMMSTLTKRVIIGERYFRFNIVIGIGEFDMMVRAVDLCRGSDC